MLKKGTYSQKIMSLRSSGRMKYPIYEIMVTSRYNSSCGSFVEKLGYFNPNMNERIFCMNSLRLAHWLSKGAIINYNVKKYLLKFKAN